MVIKGSVKLRFYLNSSAFFCCSFQKAEKSKIRLDDVPPLATADTLLKTQEGIQDVIVKEESIGQARAEEKLSNEQADTYRRQMGDKFCAMVVGIIVYCTICKVESNGCTLRYNPHTE